MAHLVSTVARNWGARLLPAVLLVGLGAGAASGADRYWDANGTAPNRGGTGIWNTSSSSWSPNGDDVRPCRWWQVDAPHAATTWCSEIRGPQAYLFRRIRDDLIKKHVEGPQGFRALLAGWVQCGFVTIIEDEIRFWNGSRIYLCHCKDEKDRFKYQGAEIHVLLIDDGSGLAVPAQPRAQVRIKVPPQYAGRWHCRPKRRPRPRRMLYLSTSRPENTNSKCRRWRPIVRRRNRKRRFGSTTRMPAIPATCGGSHRIIPPSIATISTQWRLSRL